MEQQEKTPFRALSKICLNNWHYIDRRILSFQEGINFFTGHSGSGKSTVIDAIQVVLYANSDGRAFFNKAAADDSDRTLTEYLRGMINISENNEPQYLRNKNFSSTIVLEFTDTKTREAQCVGVVFDVDTVNNDISRMFFWHSGGLLANDYRADKRCLSTQEMKEYLGRTFSQEGYYCGSSNERFRRQLYDIYLGGLDMEKFPKLFKRAIPFRMNIKLEEFVKEYICMEQDIHIEELQESVMQYGRMRRKIEQTMEEIRFLSEIQDQYALYREEIGKQEICEYQIQRLEMKACEAQIAEDLEKNRISQADVEMLIKRREGLEEEKKEKEAYYEELLSQLNKSGYKEKRTELTGLNEMIEKLEGSVATWRKTAERLAKWKAKDFTGNQTIWDIEKFEKGQISVFEMERLKDSISDMRKETEEQKREVDAVLRRIKKAERDAREELEELRQGKKAYPVEVEKAKYELAARLREKFGKVVRVQILADLLDVKEERWLNAVEGYLGNNKLLLVVEPQYAKAALDIYRGLDKKEYYRVAVLDTEKLMEHEFRVMEGALAQEVTAKEPYIRAYVAFMLGKVIKCETVEELRNQKIGITADCTLYHSFRLQHINPENYTRRAYIGEISLRQRIRNLENVLSDLGEEKRPNLEYQNQLKEILELEQLHFESEDYLGMMKDAVALKEKQKRKTELMELLQKMQEEKIDELEKRMSDAKIETDRVQQQITKTDVTISQQEEKQIQLKKQIEDRETKLKDLRADFAFDDGKEAEFAIYLTVRAKKNYDRLGNEKQREYMEIQKQRDEIYDALIEKRNVYQKSYPNRNFSITDMENSEYDKLLESLRCDDLEVYRKMADEQAKAAVEHFKDDFVFKIRSAIREALQRKDELNRIISRLDFGKDKYQFVITKNKGADGKYYSMFMNDSLQIDPSQLNGAMENQLNLFTMNQEAEYGDMMNELIDLFMVPEHASTEEMEQAQRNMKKYSDYRTYLSFDMQQIIHGEKDMTIGLGKMIKKNSGGEGQNPLYVALLASFAQLYRINLSPKVRRPSTIRLVILDEAFSKMDAEKVASCIALIRGLGFQAIISATNDKIQNYLENVDKTFVFANPNKQHISIQEFEKTEFLELLDGEES